MEIFTVLATHDIYECVKLAPWLNLRGLLGVVGMGSTYCHSRFWNIMDQKHYKKDSYLTCDLNCSSLQEMNINVCLRPSVLQEIKQWVACSLLWIIQAERDAACAFSLSAISLLYFKELDHMCITSRYEKSPGCWAEAFMSSICFHLSQIVIMTLTRVQTLVGMGFAGLWFIILYYICFKQADEHNVHMKTI